MRETSREVVDDLDEARFKSEAPDVRGRRHDAHEAPHPQSAVAVVRWLEGAS
jgi:hypothetical protein